MTGTIDTRRVKDVAGARLPLNIGLDVQTPLISRPPGSLAKAINVEIVDDNLEVTKGLGVLGSSDSAANKVDRSLYMYVGVAATDFTLTGSITDGMTVYWDDENGTSRRRRGSGLLYSDSFSGNTILTLSHVEGDHPGKYTTFYDLTQNNIVTMSTAKRFFNVDDDQLDVTMYQQYLAYLSTATTTISNPAYTWDAFRPAPPGGLAVTHVFNVGDTLYAVQDYPAIPFRSATATRPNIGDKIRLTVSAVDYDFYVAKVDEYYQSDWNASATGQLGIIHVYPQSDSYIGADPESIIYAADSGLIAIENVTQGNFVGVVDRFLDSGTSPTADPGNPDYQSGLLWKLDSDGRTNTGWKYVDMGYSCAFSGGAIAPLAVERPLFVTDAVESIQTQEQFTTLWGFTSGWTNTANLAADDGLFAYQDVAAGKNTTALRGRIDGGNLPDGARVTGLEVTVQARADGASCYPDVIQLFGNGDGTDTYGPMPWSSWNRAADYDSANEIDYSGAGDSTFVVGGQLDMWGVHQLDPDWSDAMYIEIQFRNNSVAARRISVDYVKFKYYYTLDTQTLYFHDADGTSSEASGEMYAYQVHDGEWSSDDAKGWFTFTSVTNPGVIRPGMTIWTTTDQSGDQIGVVEHFEKNTLPNHRQMQTAKTRCRSYTSSIGRGPDSLAAYVVNGVGPCFAVDKESRFQFIRTPALEREDQPRHVSEIYGHLILGLDRHLFISSIGSPNVFHTYDGATVFAIGDRLTGLVQSPDNTIQVFGQDSVQVLSGTAASGQDQFQLRRHARTGGAKDYSPVLLGTTWHMTEFGLGTFETSADFGNFDLNRFNKGIEPWLRPRLQVPSSEGLPSAHGLLEVIPVRAKNQLRAFFNDGWILCITLPASGTQEAPRFTHIHYGLDLTTTSPKQYPSLTLPTDCSYSIYDWFSPACLHTYIDSTGKERIVAGSESGYVYEIDAETNSPYESDVGPTSPRDTQFLFALNPIFASNPLDGSLYSDGVTLGVESTAYLALYAQSTQDMAKFEKQTQTEFQVLSIPHFDSGFTEPWDGRAQLYSAESFQQVYGSSVSYQFGGFASPRHIHQPRFVMASAKLREGGQRKARASRAMLYGSQTSENTP